MQVTKNVFDISKNDAVFASDQSIINFPPAMFFVRVITAAGCVHRRLNPI